MTNTKLRFPAEWEPQAAILIAWPHVNTDWAERLGEVEDTYIALVAAITRFQPVLICVADDDVEMCIRDRHMLAGQRHRIPGFRVTAGPRRTVIQGKAAKPANLDTFATG